MSTEQFTASTGTSRVDASRIRLEAVVALIAGLQAGLQPAQDAYHGARNKIEALTPQHDRLMQERASAAGRTDMMPPSGDLIADNRRRAQFRKERDKELAECDAKIAALNSQFHGLIKQRSDGENALKSIDLQTRQARQDLERAQAEYDAARLAEAVGPHAALFAELLDRSSADQVRKLLIAALPAALESKAAA